MLCQYCLDEEIEICYCKNFCKRNQSMSVNQAKKNKYTCDQCLECPLCLTVLVKRKLQGYFFCNLTENIYIFVLIAIGIQVL